MVGVPVGNTNRGFMLNTRITDEERDQMEARRKALGLRSRSEYVRRLIAEDTKDLARPPKAKGNG